MQEIIAFIASAARYVIPTVGAVILIYCAVSLLRHKFPAPEYAALVDEKTGEVFPLTFWEISLGRSNTCDIVVPGDMTVSRFHAVIARRKKGWTLIDTRSKTGTFVNGSRINSKMILENGDKLTFGNASYRFQL